MKTNKKLLVLTSIIILLPVLFGIYVWQELPEKMPIHFLMSGQVDGWASKPVAVFLTPVILLAAHLLVIIITAFDNKTQRQSSKIQVLIYAIVPALSSFVAICTYGKALGYAINIPITSGILFGLFFIIMGNYLPKIRQNRTIGIRLPWTLNSEEVWNKTHHLAGFLWVIGGVVILIDSFLNIAFWELFFGAVVLMVVVPSIYAYYSYHHQ